MTIIRRGRTIGMLLAVLGGGTRAAAQTAAPSVVEQFWPEIDYYQRLGEHSRFYGSAGYTVGETKQLSEAQYGVNLDLFLTAQPPLGKVFGAGSLAMDRRLPAMLRLGYRYAQGVSDGEPYHQQRLIAELTLRTMLGRLVASDRHGVDWRWTDGVYSTRYRNRMYVEHPVGSQRYEATPYAAAEVFYVITGQYWSSVKYELGVQLPVVSHFTVELYLSRQNFWGATDDPAIDAVGTNFVLSW